jgi:hypothetical protein
MSQDRTYIVPKTNKQKVELPPKIAKFLDTTCLCGSEADPHSVKDGCIVWTLCRKCEKPFLGKK